MQALDVRVPKFLLALSKNNNRDWYNAHSKEAKAARKAWNDYVNQFIEAARKQGKLGGLEAKQCTFRLNRDVRFSKDKTPFNTHLSAFITPGGKKSPEAGFFFRIKPDGESVIGGGMWQIEKSVLQSIRQEIDYNPSEWHKLLENKAFKTRFGTLEGEKLKRPPKGYDAEHPEVEYLKHKQFLWSYSVPYTRFLDEDFAEELVHSNALMQPLFGFLNLGIEAQQQ